MTLKLSDNFLDAYSELTSSEQAQTKKCLQLFRRDKQAPSLRLHKLQHPSADVYSLSPNSELRIILFGLTPAVALHVDHHDAAYEWASRRAIISDPSLDLHEIVPMEYRTPAGETTPHNAPYAALANRLRDSGLPDKLADLIRSASNEDDFWHLLEYFSPSLQEIVIEHLSADGDSSPRLNDVRSQVTTVENDSELEDALRYPVDKWRVFLHSKQERVAAAATKERIAVVGGPGTGKTVVLVHRAKKILQRSSTGRVLFTTFEPSLAEEVIRLLKRLDPETAARTFVLTNEDFVALDLEVDADKLYLEGDRIRHILFDEAQDAGNETLEHLDSVLRKTDFGLTLAYDLNQSIYRGTKPRLFSLIEDRGFRRVRLEFSYRTTAQIAHYLTKLREELEQLPIDEKRMFDATTSEIRAGLSGPEIQKCDESTARSCFEKLKLQYSVDELFITNVVRYRSGGHRRTQYFDAELDDEYGRYYRSPFSLKGLEFYAGVIIADQDHVAFSVEERIPERYTVRGSLSDESVANLRDYYLPRLEEDRIELELPSDNLVHLSWRGDFPDEVFTRLLNILGHRPSLRDLVSRLKQTADQKYEPASKDLLFRLNLLHVAVSRCRDTAVIGMRTDG